MKSVNIGALAVRPVPQEMLEKVSCTHCGTAARWEIGQWNYACSTCFLYELPVVKGQRTEVDKLVSEVGRAVGRPLVCEDGRVVGPDADRVATGVVLAQRFELARGLR